MTRPVRPLQRMPVADMATAIGAANAGEPVVLMDEGGRPAAVVLSPAEYDRLRRQDRRAYGLAEMSDEEIDRVYGTAVAPEVEGEIEGIQP